MYAGDLGPVLYYSMSSCGRVRTVLLSHTASVPVTVETACVSAQRQRPLTLRRW